MESPAAAAAGENDTITPKKPLSSLSIFLLMAPLCLSVLLSSLDLTVITPAIPAIVSSFSSSSSSSSSTYGYIWIGTAFILSNTSITPVWGSISDIWGRKPVVLTAHVVFLAGSLVCALARNMEGLIAGRVVQGMGASGMGTMVNVIICDSFSLRDRGLYLAITSVVWAIGGAVGPVLGGWLTGLEGAGWRWCFWLNLPIGGVVFLALLFVLNVPNPNTPVLEGLKAIDWAGSLLIVGAAVMILLGLEFGDVTFPWSSATVICLLVFGCAVLGLFILNEWKFAINPVIPLRLFSNRSSVAAYSVFACVFYVQIGLAWYLPLYSQSALGADALNSGLHLLPLIVSCSLASACTGVFIQKTGKYLPVMYFSQVLFVLGAGLFLNLELEQSLTKLFLFEIITGTGIGMNIEPPVLAAMAATTVLDTASVVATMGFIRSIATAIAVVLGGVIFQNQMNAANGVLVDKIGPQLASNFTGGHATANVEFIHLLPTDEQTVVRETYFGALRSVWIMYLVVAGISLLSNMFVRGHHLSVTTEEAVLGIDRTKRVQHGGQTTNADAGQSRSIELQAVQPALRDRSGRE
ncbi:major facilitator superfamily domain containing protein [Rhypophila decipiens]